ncbi:MAG: DUF4162 domain-containing protein, partial [Pseudomonadota bacterium]
AARRAERWLARLDLARWSSHRVQELSKGMQQKVQFVTALLHEPDLLILDEPWSGLDPLNTDVLLEIVREEKDRGKTILFSTHLMDQAERLCDEVCIISRGRKVAAGTVGDLRRAGARERTVLVSFATVEDDALAQSVFGDRALVQATSKQSAHFEVELPAGSFPQQLLERLVEAGARIRRFEVAEPSLHQVFVERVRAEEAAL